MAFQPYVCMQTHSTCYKGTSHPMQIKGVLWHSTGANNPNLKRYVQPYEGDPNYNADIAKLGYNANHNDWNHIYREAGLNAWIGKFADGSVGTVQTMPWDYKPWGCGSAYKGGPSCNNGWIQFEICEDGLNDKVYAQKVWDEAIAFTVYICQMFKLDPLGTASCSGRAVPVITCHNDAAKLGCAGNHSDINHWFPKILGKNMENARQEVAAKMGKTPTPQPTPQPTPTPTPTPAASTTTITIGILKKGMKGSLVKKLQQLLIGEGYNLKPYNDDGSFGPATENVVKEFQKKKGLTQNGIVEQKTWEALLK